MDQMIVQRRNGAYLAPMERQVLMWLAERLPPAITPNILTTLGVFGAIIAALGYALASHRPAMLWIATAGIALNWFGDSLDGTVARWRRIERPCYGYFLDNSVDLGAQALFGVGLGLSGYIRWDLAMAGLAAFFMVTMLSLIRAQASHVLDIACFGIGLTEIRCILIALNTIMYLLPPEPFHFLGLSVTYPNVLAGVWLIGHVAIFLAVTIAHGRHLAAEDPPRHSDVLLYRVTPSRLGATDSPQR